jgi:hypothetical protein
VITKEEWGFFKICSSVNFSLFSAGFEIDHSSFQSKTNPLGLNFKFVV